MRYLSPLRKVLPKPLAAGTVLAALALTGAPPASAQLAVGPSQTWAYVTSGPFLVNQATKQCLTSIGPGQPTPVQGPCPSPSAAQRFQVESQSITSQNPATQRYCLTGTGPDKPTILQPCNGGNAQRYAYDATANTIRNLASGLCLTATAANQPTVMRTCT
ncbi:RICIN domain-containing protein [Spirillospora sp. NPDC050679]